MIRKDICPDIKLIHILEARLAKEVFREKHAHISGYDEFYLSEKERLNTGKDSLRWKYPPTYFD